MARRELSNGRPQATKKARHLGKASYVTSVAGIVIIFVVLVVVSQQFVNLGSVEFVLKVLRFIRSIISRICKCTRVIQMRQERSVQGLKQKALIEFEPTPFALNPNLDL